MRNIPGPVLHIRIVERTVGTEDAAGPQAAIAFALLAVFAFNPANDALHPRRP
jgi:hypothetical protein